MEANNKMLQAETVHFDFATFEGEANLPQITNIQPKAHFSLWQTLGMNFSITAAPIAIGLYTSLVIGLGGFPFYIWAFLVAIFFQLITALAIAELASAIPHSSGPAFWVQHLAPPKYSKFLGYLTGWLTNAVWWFVSAFSTLYLAQLTLGTVIANHNSYQPPQWHYFLVYCAWALAMYIPNLPFIFKILPGILFLGVFVINGTSIYFLVALLVRSTPKQSADAVFVQVVNTSGWSDTVVFFLTLIPGVLTVGGFDAVTHITDELDNPRKQVPQVIVGSAVLSALAAFIMAIVYAFCTVDPASLLTPYGNQPLVQLLFDSLRSPTMATVGSSFMILGAYISLTASFTSWNRLFWSFARTGGLPFSQAMSKLASKDALPVNASVVNLALVIALGAIQLGSLTALNAIAGSAIVCATLTYSITFTLVLSKGHSHLDRSRWLNLGRAGPWVHSVALFWCIFVTIWACFPLYLPVVIEYMNWTAVVVAGIILVSVMYYFICGVGNRDVGVGV